tara:strand:+ start:1011 stop:1550 length:540 start_codon:yes stop_codon:yes gene_type:complete
MMLLGLLGLLFAFGFVFNLVQDPIQVAEAGVGGCIALAALGGFAFLWRKAREEDRLLAWLDEHQGQGHLDYQGVPITEDSELYVHEVVVSFLVVTLKEEVVSLDPARARWNDLWCSLISLSFGWWTFPRGPLVTIASITRNHVGAGRASLSERLAAWRAEAGRLADGGALKKPDGEVQG